MFECPVCGSPELRVPPYATWPPPHGLTLSLPYEEQLGRPSYEVCPNCGFEFGNDDSPGTAQPTSFEDYRADWQRDGSPRFDQSSPARPSVHPGIRPRRDPDNEPPFTLEVDGELFEVGPDESGGTGYTWLSGPNKGYGFGTNTPPDRSKVEQHRHNVRQFLAMIDPATGYIADD